MKLCTFSRVMREKGIEDAVNAVKAVNDGVGYVYPTRYNTSLIALLKEAAVNPTVLLEKERHCLIEAEKYKIEKAVQVIFEQIERD